MDKSLLILLFITVFANSQTKLISHKSHSGSNETFAIAIENELFEGDNLGLGRMEIQEVTNLDSIVYLSKDKVIAYTSNYTQRYYQAFKDKCTRDELTKIKTDTLKIIPSSLKNGLTIQDVKVRIDSSKIYSNDLSQVKYKDFEEKTKRKKNRKRNYTLPIIPNFPNIPNSFFLILILGFLSVLVYLISAKFQSNKLTLSN